MQINTQAVIEKKSNFDYVIVIQIGVVLGSEHWDN